MTRARIRAGLVALLVFAGASQLAAGAWIHVKAGVAQVLLRSAWARTKRDAWARTERDVSARTGRDALAPIQRGASAPAQRDDAPHRPWPWADTAPVARLTAPRLDVDLIVLDGFSAQALAFGPGLVRGENGTLVLSAHRDSHFAFLRDVRPGERLVLERAGEAPREYRVRATRVVDYRAAGEILAGRPDALVLVTCWPFDALVPGGPLRLLVLAEADRAS